MIRIKDGRRSESKRLHDLRSFTVQLGSKSVTTPTRVLTSSEIRRKRYVPTQIPLTNEVVIIDVSINAEALVNPSKSANNKINKAIKKLESLYGDLYKLHYLMPYVYPSGEKRKDILRNRNHIEKALGTIKLILSPFIEADYSFDIVLVPPFELGYSDYLDVLEKFMKAIENNDQIPVPVIDISHESFPKLIDYLVSNHGLTMIGVKYRKIVNNLSHYAYLYNNYKEKDVAFLIIDVDHRIDLGVKDVALPNYMPMLGFDIIASRLSYGRPPRMPSFNFRLMDRTKLQLPLINSLDKSYRIRLFSELDINLDEGVIGDMIRVLTHDELLKRVKSKIIEDALSGDSKKKREAQEKYTRLYSLTRLQEIKASTKELSFLRDFILHDEIDEYYELRSNTKIVIKQINLKDITQFISSK